MNAVVQQVCTVEVVNGGANLDVSAGFVSTIGGVHAAVRNADGGFEAAGDPRRGGSTGFA